MEVDKEVIKLLNYAYRYLSYRMRTEKEIETYLLQKAETKNIQKDLINKVIEDLKEQGYINDFAFIEEFIHSRSNSKPKSEFVLSLELKQKGVKPELIESYFQQNPLNEDQLARKALQSKWSSYQTYSTEERRRKATNFLQRRGFNFSIIKKTIEEFTTEE